MTLLEAVFLRILRRVKLYFFIRDMEVSSRQFTRPRDDTEAVHELIFCREGSGRIIAGDHSSGLQAGGLLFDPDGRLTAEQDRLQVTQILFSEELFSHSVPMEREALYVLGIIKIHARSQNSISLSPIGTERVTMLLGNMLWEFRERRRGYSWALRLKLIELLITVMRDRRFPIAINGLKPLPTTRMQDVILYLQREFMNQVTVQDVLEFCPFSRSHFHSLFKQETGRTFVQYLSALRCDHAARELQATDKPIVDVAMESGFNNLSHFYHVFKRHRGMSPRAFRLSDPAESGDVVADS